MSKTAYTGAVSKLLEIGKPEWAAKEIESWLDYPAKYDLSATDIPHLIKLATEEVSLDDDDEKAAYAPVHAWRALGQLKAEAAIEPLLKLLDTEDDFAAQDIPLVYGLLGPKALPKLTDYLSKHIMDELSLAGMNAVDSITRIGQSHPEAAEKAGAALTKQLENYKNTAADLNGAVIVGLTVLKVESALPLIQQAFEDDKVDIMHTDWDSVQFGFGLIDEAEYKKREVVNNAKRRELQQAAFGSPPRQLLTPETPATTAEVAPKVKRGSNKISSAKKEKAKAKRKIEKASRKINRKK